MESCPRCGQPLPERYLNVQSVMKILDISRSYVHKLVSENHLPAFKAGDGKTAPLRFRWRDVCEFLESRPQNEAAEPDPEPDPRQGALPHLPRLPVPD